MALGNDLRKNPAKIVFAIAVLAFLLWMLMDDLSLAAFSQRSESMRQGSKFGILIGSEWRSAEKILLSKGTFRPQLNGEIAEAKLLSAEGGCFNLKHARAGDELRIYDLRDWRRMTICLGLTDGRVTSIAWNSNWIDL